jgi:hypothetical protein
MQPFLTPKTPPDGNRGLSSVVPFILPSPEAVHDDEPCCGAPAGPPASPFDKPGYTICPFVDRFLTTAVGVVPVVRTRLSLRDRLSTVLTRMNIGRNHYTVAPGLYATGQPGDHSPVLVTANYKLSFDHLRAQLSGLDAWLLVLDTRGINVWCAAGKKTFGTDELVNRLRMTRLAEIIVNKRLIVPQLGATGVSARDVKKRSGFSVTWGPVHCRDLRRFLEQGMTADPAMRTVTFSLAERLVLIPVEIALVLKHAAVFFLATLVFSGLGPDLFSLSAMIDRGLPALSVLTGGLVAGTVLTPALLHRLPGKAFSLKGMAAGLFLSVPTALVTARFTGISGVLGLVLTATAIASWLAMNFTGSTPYTSPTGVEKEMRRSIPIQLAAALSGALLWLFSAF